MPVEFVRDIINYKELIGEGSSQTMVNGDIVLPERNPEISKVLNMNSRVTVNSCETTDDKIILEGKVDFDVLYASTIDNPGMFRVNASSNFTHNIQVPGAQDKMSCEVMPNIEHTEYELLTNKKIKVNAVIDMKGMVFKKSTAEAITDINGEDVQILKDTMRAEEFIAENTSESDIKGKIELTDGMPEVKAIVRNDIYVHKSNVSVQEGKAIINGCVHVSIMYETVENPDMKNLEQDITFTNEVEMPGLKPGMRCDAAYKIMDTYNEVKENENAERKIIEVEVVLEMNAAAYAGKELPIIIDAYSQMERYELERQSLKSVSYFGEGTDSQSIKERLTLPDDLEPINEIKYVTASPIITEIKAIEDKVTAEGIVNFCIMYSAASEEGAMFSFEEEIPFRSTIDIPGARIEMLPKAEAYVEHISYDKVSQREVDVKTVIECLVKLFSKLTLDYVKTIQQSEIPANIKNMPSIVIYIVQPHDTLWKIAKKYCTTIEDIIKINDIDNPDIVTAGVKLLIPKKTFKK